MIAIMAFGSTGLILIGGFFDNIIEGFREQFIHSQTGHLQISARGYNRKGITAPFDYLMWDASAIEKVVKSNPHVRLTMPRVQFSGMLASDQTSVPVMILGVDAEGEQKMGEFKYRDAFHPSIHIAEGEDLNSDHPYDAVLGKGLLKALGVNVGDTVSLMTMRAGGAIDGAQFRVRGAFETIAKESDDHTIKIDLSSARRLFGLNDAAHSIVVLADRTENAPFLQEELGRVLNSRGFSTEIATWEELGLMSQQIKSLFEKIYFVIQLIVSVVFFFSIANTLNMAFFERIHEFGTMMALGNGRRHILAVILAETCLLGLLGGAVGAVIGSLISLVVSTVGIEMPPPPMGSYGYYAVIALSPKLLFSTFKIAMVSAVLASLTPSCRIINMPIVEALVHA